MIEIQANRLWTKIDQAVDDGYRIIVNRWGTRSGKTYTIIQKLIVRLYTGKIWSYKLEKWVCSIVRQYATTLRGTVLRDFLDIAWELQLLEYFEYNKTNKTFEFNDRTIEFIWADDAQKLKWAKRDILYCNEADELEYQTQFFQLMIRTKWLVFIDFNPDDVDVWINTEIEQRRAQEKKDVKVIVSTYKDNSFLTPVEIEEIENIKNIDPVLWEVYGRWGYGKMQWLVFNSEIIDWVPENAKYIAHWLDWWFTNDPTAIVAIYQLWDDIIIDELVYIKWLTINNIHYELLDNMLDKWEAIIYADNSDPRWIEELNEYWWDVEWAKKWKDSIVAWINFMKQYRILITRHSKNVIKEFNKYRRKLDKSWKSTNKPIGMYDHAIDAARYAITMWIGRVHDSEINLKSLLPYKF